jgi:uncharacterized protein YdaU (DUF1376 family)
MSNSPAFQFYPREWLSDFDARALTDAQRGFYLDLVCYCWEADGLPNDTKKIAAAMNRPLQSFLKLWSTGVSDLFFERDGKLYNQKLEREKAKQAERSSRAKSSVSKRWQKDTTDSPDTNVLPTYYERNTIIEDAVEDADAVEEVLSVPAEESTGKITGDLFAKHAEAVASTPAAGRIVRGLTQQQKDNFERMWATTAKRGSKKRAKEIYARLNPDAHLAEIIRRYMKFMWEDKWQAMVAADREDFIPHTTTILNGEDWEQYIPEIEEAMRQDENVMDVEA